MYLRKHDALAQIAVGFGISIGTAHAYATAVIDLLAARAPGLLKVPREHEPQYVLLDGTLAECDRVGDGRADYSHKHRRHGVTDPIGQVLWISPALPVPRPDRGPRSPDHPDLRTPGCPRPSRTAPTSTPASGPPPGAEGRPAGSCPPHSRRSTGRGPDPGSQSKQCRPGSRGAPGTHCAPPTCPSGEERAEHYLPPLAKDLPQSYALLVSGQS
ncbi:hypothetical protein GCM10010503_36930 [Streptomyces lucensis JCM 4490]|uniref:Transposase Helix-turn-helix domain-containing protein n=1 Tax=Streptomyces lucensis JCM 4490 TaxID=1306176 RepID=A0A918J7L6_9ACTN|nr:hypothetical protein GCM10010503_36930 [Streptomyces lucensis JCM 4490]